MRLSIIVLQYGQVEFTLECIKSILPQLKMNDSLVVVDNASPSGFQQLYEFLDRPLLMEISSERRVYTNNKNVYLLKAAANLGYGAGNNIGAAYAFRQLASDFVWILNNDTRLAPDALAELTGYLECHSEKALVGHTVLDYGSDRVQTLGGAKYNPLLAVGRRVAEGADVRQLAFTEAAVLAQLDYMTGASFAISRRAYQQTALFDPRYFLYFEEIDLARRVREAGLSFGWASRVIVEHREGTSINPEEKSELAEYHATLSALLATQRHFPLLLPLTAAIRMFYKLARYAVARKPALIKAHLAGMAAFTRRNGESRYRS